MKTTNPRPGLALLLSFSFAMHVAAAAEGKEKAPVKPLNEAATAAAWEALDNEKFEDAIKNADKCIEEFRGAAIRLQEKLENEKARVPNGAVTEAERKKIHENALLNDVTTCLFIKGKAAEKMDRKDVAIKAYTEAKKMTFARTWDLGGWFWSPAEASADRLAGLK